MYIAKSPVAQNFRYWIFFLQIYIYFLFCCERKEIVFQFPYWNWNIFLNILILLGIFSFFPPYQTWKDSIINVKMFFFSVLFQSFIFTFKRFFLLVWIKWVSYKYFIFSMNKDKISKLWCNLCKLSWSVRNI